jgi:heme-degrading monooxygenase HmoA
MIARVWKGWAMPDDADGYASYYREEVVSGLREIEGFLGAELLRRADGDEVELVSVTRFESMTAVRAFAGDNAEVAVVTPHARQFLSHFEPTCAHYTIDVAE